MKPVLLKIFLFFGLLFIQSLGVSSKGNYTYFSEIASVTVNLSSEKDLHSRLYSPEALHLPDALVTPIPSFQFACIEVLGCFLFVMFSFYALTKIRETTPLFISSYFRTLFLSVILINAP